VEAFRAGAKGIFSREQPFEALCKSAHKVHEGHIWASNRQVHYLIDSLAETGTSTPVRESKEIPLLTKREQSLVQLVTEGRTNRDISRELGLSEHTAQLLVSHFQQARNLESPGTRAVCAEPSTHKSRWGCRVKSRLATEQAIQKYCQDD
jgi:DNA-binding NarL/FixJ family response regulator